MSLLGFTGFNSEFICFFLFCAIDLIGFFSEFPRALPGFTGCLWFFSGLFFFDFILFIGFYSNFLFYSVDFLKKVSEFSPV